MEPTNMDLYAVQGYRLLAVRDRIVKITSDIDYATLAHNNLIARLQAELADLQNEIRQQGFTLTGVSTPAKIHPKYWVSGDKVKRISGKNPNVYTRGKEYVVLAVCNEDGRHTLHITDDFSVNGTSYCAFGLAEAEEKFELFRVDKQY